MSNVAGGDVNLQEAERAERERGLSCCAPLPTSTVMESCYESQFKANDGASGSSDGGTDTAVSVTFWRT